METKTGKAFAAHARCAISMPTLAGINDSGKGRIVSGSGQAERMRVRSGAIAVFPFYATGVIRSASGRPPI